MSRESICSMEDDEQPEPPPGPPAQSPPADADTAPEYTLEDVVTEITKKMVHMTHHLKVDIYTGAGNQPVGDFVRDIETLITVINDIIRYLYQ